LVRTDIENPARRQAVKRVLAHRRPETAMLDTILNNHLLLALVIILFLVLIPALVVRGHKLRESTRLDRRQHPRGDLDRRA
jgi:hypothetical protein